MGFDWENIRDASGRNLADVYDQTAADALYQSHLKTAPPGMRVDPGDQPLVLPFDES